MLTREEYAKIDAEIISITQTNIRNYEAEHGYVAPASASLVKRRRHTKAESPAVLKRLLMDRGAWDDAAERKRLEAVKSSQIQ